VADKKETMRDKMQRGFRRADAILEEAGLMRQSRRVQKSQAEKKKAK
jgi:hypothetical protein